MLVSVIMSAFNAEKFINKSIESILNQTLEDFEFIIIDDASTDSTVEIIENFEDKRIVFLKNKKNLGLTKNLNIAISIAHGDYIARMDSDDISAPNRLERQVTFMEENKGVDICGTWGYRIYENGRKKFRIKSPINNQQIKNRLLCSNCMIHPSIMVKKDLFDELQYDESYRTAQDYKLWADCFEKNFYNIPEYLIFYRRNTKGISVKEHKDASKRIDLLANIYNEILKKSGCYLNADEIILYTRCVQNLDHFESAKESNAALELCKKVARECKMSDTRYLYTRWAMEHKSPPLNSNFLLAVKGTLLRFAEIAEMFFG